MPYVSLDDNFADHPKILPISDAAFRLHVRAICYANRQLTDGRIPADFVGRRHTVAEQLVKADLWHIHPDGGWQLHDYRDWNKSAEQVRRERVKARERKRKERGSPDPEQPP